MLQLLLRQSKNRKGGRGVEPFGNFNSTRKQVLGTTLLEVQALEKEMGDDNYVHECQIIHELHSESI